MRLILKPITLREANAFVAEHHTRHGAVRGCKFSVGCFADGRLCGVVIVERPKARYLDDGGYTLELTRVCTDGTPNVASKLIAAATRAAFAMGARRVISYVGSDEDGTSYRAAAWLRVEDASGQPIEFGGGEWSRPSREREPMQSPTGKKHRWERYNLATLEDVRREAA
jgi:hypothetical protein